MAGDGEHFFRGVLEMEGFSGFFLAMCFFVMEMEEKMDFSFLFF
jgi:hypothetical protein